MSSALPTANNPDENPIVETAVKIAFDEDGARLCRDIPDDQCREEPRNIVWHILAQGLSKIGDTLADPKIVLPWLIGSMGGPAFVVGLLVPIRESLALLPQILVGGFIRRFAVRKYFWVIASLVEGICIIAMGLAALAGISGRAAGWTIVGLLIVFSLSRGIASIASKDVLGKTVSKGRRGRIGGYASTASGVVACGVGLYLLLGPEAGRPDWLLYAVLIGAGACWLCAALAFVRLNEHPGATDGGRGIGEIARNQLSMLFQETELQRFIVTRTLMLSTALASPVYVSLAQANTGGSLDGLGWMVLSTGAAAAVASSLWGYLSDRSSRFTLALASGGAGLIGVVVLVAILVDAAITGSTVFYASILFLQYIVHEGVRIGRKTHIVDLASGDRKSDFVALSNTVIGILMLVVGGAMGLLLGVGMTGAITVLTCMALAGAAMAMTMQNVQE